MDSPTNHPAQRGNYDRWIIALLVLAALAPFVRAAFFPYVYDDRAIIRGNPDIRGWSSLLTLWGKPYWNGAADAGLYRPAFVAVLAFVWNLGARVPFWFHTLAIAMHALATVLVWRMLRRAVRNAIAVIAALWFAVLPVHIEAVANVANSSEVLVAIWCCALSLYLSRAERTTPSDVPIPWGAAVVAAAIFGATFLSKESGIVAPFAAAIWVWGWRASSEKPDADVSARVRAFAERWWRVVAACAIAGVVIFAARRVVLGGFVGAPVAPGFVGLSAWQRIWAMLGLWPQIGLLLVWPPGINPEYGPTALTHFGPSLPGVATLLALGALAVVAVRAARAGDRRLLAALGWFAVTFAPASNLVTATPQILTERTLYGPSIALAFCAALLISAIASSPRVSLLPTSAFLHRAAVAATAILIVATGLRTLHYTAVWRSNEAVFRQMIIADSASYRGYWKLAGYAKSRNQFDESLSLYERAYRLYPRDRQLLADYAQTLLDQGQPRRAATIARQLMTWPEVRRMPNVVSLYLAALGQAYGADSVIRAGSDLFAAERMPTAALFVGAAHEARGDSNAAEQSYRAGLDIAPTDTALRRRLAVVQKPQR